MKRIVKAQLEEELRARGIPEYARRLAARFGYDAERRKRLRNPDEQDLIDEARRKVRHSGAPPK
jgi:hypothetical protein